jgi:hypothetical protein
MIKEMSTHRSLTGEGRGTPTLHRAGLCDGSDSWVAFAMCQVGRRTSTSPTSRHTSNKPSGARLRAIYRESGSPAIRGRKLMMEQIRQGPPEGGEKAYARDFPKF